MEGWVVPLTAVATATGNLTQCYPDWAVAGAAYPGTSGQTLRQPIEGQCFSLQVQTDGTNGGVLELWDISGIENGIDVSSGTTITNAQLVAAQALGRAKLIYSQNFIASPETPFNMGYKGFQKGLAARFVASTGTCKLNLVVDGGFRYVEKL